MTKKQEERKKLIDFFLSIWRSRPHKSEISGIKIYGECKTIYMHHILPSRKFPEAKYDPQNLIILLPDEHGNVENDHFRYEEINKRREQLKIKYGL